MLRIVYASSANQEFTPESLKQLLLRARMRNHDCNVTGMLIHDNGLFLQALEGDEAAVESIYSRIRQDPRHKEIELLFRDPKAKHRAFGEWSMGFADSTGGAQILRGFVLEAGLGTMSPLNEKEAIGVLNRYATRAF